MPFTYQATHCQQRSFMVVHVSARSFSFLILPMSSPRYPLPLLLFPDVVAVHLVTASHERRLTLTTIQIRAHAFLDSSPSFVFLVTLAHSFALASVLDCAPEACCTPRNDWYMTCCTRRVPCDPARQIHVDNNHAQDAKSRCMSLHTWPATLSFYRPCVKSSAALCR